MRRNDHVLQRCRNGERLAKTITTNRAGNPVTSYCLEPSGTHVTEGQALGLLNSGKFVPVGYGLFDVESSQTWRLRTQGGHG
jgi:hypothetical protein